MEAIINNREDLAEFNSADIPKIITKQVHQINVLERKISEVIQEATKAKEAAINANEKIGLSGRKKAIEQLQSSGREIASAIQVSAQAHQQSFEFQKELADISKFLIGLGVSNIAQNRIVVRELEMKMNGASKEQISDLAKQELLSVIRQLKAQEHIQERLERLSSTIKEHKVKLTRYETLYKQHDESLSKVTKGLTRLDNELLKLAENDTKRNIDLTKLKESYIRQDDKLAKQNCSLDKYKAELEKRIKIDKEQEQQIEDLQIQLKRLNKRCLISMISLGVGLIIILVYLLNYLI